MLNGFKGPPGRLCCLGAGGARGRTRQLVHRRGGHRLALQKPHQTIAKRPTPGATLQVTNGVDFGWGGQVAFGRSFGPFRLEAELGRDGEQVEVLHRHLADLDHPAAGRQEQRHPLHGQRLLRFPAGSLPVSIYVGAGIGAADARVTTFAAPARAPTIPPSQLIDASETETAYQLMAGLRWPLSEKLSLTAQYRWFDAGTVDGKDSRGEAITRAIAGHNIDVGLRLTF